MRFDFDRKSLIDGGGDMMGLLLDLGGFAALALLILLAIRANGRKVPSSWFAVPGLTVWSVATLSTIQELQIVRAAASQVTDDMQASMTSSGYSIAHTHVWLGWGLASLLFVGAGLGLAIVAICTAGKGARVNKKIVAMMLLATTFMTPLTFVLCFEMDYPHIIGFAGGIGAAVATLGMLGLTLASVRLHPEDEARRAASASDQVAVGLLATLAVICMLMSFGMHGAIEAFAAFNVIAEVPAEDFASEVVRFAGNGVALYFMCFDLAKWLAAVLLLLTTLVCRPVLGLAFGSN
jgi:hypothetical protein